MWDSYHERSRTIKVRVCFFLRLYRFLFSSLQTWRKQHRLQCRQIARSCTKKRKSHFSHLVLKKISERTLQYYTGLETCAEFRMLSGSLGPAVDHLSYHGITPQMSVEDQCFGHALQGLANIACGGDMQELAQQTSTVFQSVSWDFTPIMPGDTFHIGPDCSVLDQFIISVNDTERILMSLDTSKAS